MVTEWRNVRGSYFSYHIKVAYQGRMVPEWLIEKNPQESNWILYYFDPINTGKHLPIPGVQPFKRLKDAKYYVDVEVQRFLNSL